MKSIVFIYSHFKKQLDKYLLPGLVIYTDIERLKQHTPFSISRFLYELQMHKFSFSASSEQGVYFE